MSIVEAQIIRDSKRGGFFVAVGPYETRQEAAAALAALQTASDLENRVTRRQWASEPLLEAVRTIYESCGSLSGTAKRLNEAQIATPRGKRVWTATTVGRVLKLKSY